MTGHRHSLGNLNPGTLIADVTDTSFSGGYCGILASGGTSNQYNEFSVLDLSEFRTVSNDTFTLTTGAYGEVSTLKFLNEPYDTNFVVNEVEHRYDVGKNQFLGEMKFSYQIDGGPEKTGTTGDSEDIRQIQVDSANDRIMIDYVTDSLHSDGIKGASDFSLEEAFTLYDDFIEFSITISNKTSKTIRFNDIALPVSWNNHWQFESPYETYLAATNNYISYNGSYLMLERAKGWK